MPTMEWAGVTGNDERKTVLKVDDVAVARLIDRIDGTWFVLLDYHLDHTRHRRRDCTSFEAGVRGSELWAARHMTRLQQEAAERRAKWQVLPTLSAEERAARPPHVEREYPPHPGKRRSRKRDHR
jgi:hypothetical protein